MDLPQFDDRKRKCSSLHVRTSVVSCFAATGRAERDEEFSRSGFRVLDVLKPVPIPIPRLVNEAASGAPRPW